MGAITQSDCIALQTQIDELTALKDAIYQDILKNPGRKSYTFDSVEGRQAVTYSSIKERQDFYSFLCNRIKNLTDQLNGGRGLKKLAVRFRC